VTERGDLTRERLLDAAEQLWAANGLHSVSVRDINHAAGQRNNNALHYHFGGRTGLLAALAERHLSLLNERTDKLWAETRAAPSMSVRDQVAVLVRPTAEYLGDGPSARAWLVVSSQLLADPQQSDERTASVVSQAAIDVGTMLVERLVLDLGRAAAIERVRMASEAVLHLIADRARLEEAALRARSLIPLPVFVELVIDMTTAAIASNPSDSLLRVVAPMRHSP
jgi:AcrR family transcriptional regulator